MREATRGPPLAMVVDREVWADRSVCLEERDHRITERRILVAPDIVARALDPDDLTFAQETQRLLRRLGRDDRPEFRVGGHQQDGAGDPAGDLAPVGAAAA